MNISSPVPAPAPHHMHPAPPARQPLLARLASTPCLAAIPLLLSGCTCDDADEDVDGDGIPNACDPGLLALLPPEDPEEAELYFRWEIWGTPGAY